MKKGNLKIYEINKIIYITLAEVEVQKCVKHFIYNFSLNKTKSSLFLYYTVIFKKEL